MLRKNIFIIIFLLAVVFISTGFAQDKVIDNAMGDYLLSSVNKTISMDLEGANLVDVLKMLSQQSGLNFVSTEAVKERKITLYMSNTPLKEALDIIFRANNLTYDYYIEGNIFVVKEMGKPTVELKTKVYRLKYARVKSSRLENEIYYKLFSSSISSSGGGSGSSSGSATGTSQDTGIRYAVENVLTEFGKVTEDPSNNALIVVDVPSQFPIIDKVINELDKAPPQVMIEVEMLDVSKNLVDKLGIKYENGLTGQLTPGSMRTPWPFPKRLVKQIPSGGSPAAVDRLTMGTFDLSSFTSLIEFLSTDTSTKFIARPKILSISGEIAEVNITTDEAIGVTTTADSTAGGTLTQEVERTETGTKLRITPLVNEQTGEITLFVEVFNRSATDSGISISGLTGNLKNPEERGTKSVVRIKDGETLLIGGLLKKDKKKTYTYIPVLGDIPFLGALFRHRNKTDDQRELMVFITPHIISGNMAVNYHRSNNIFRESSFSKSKSVKIALDKFSKY